MPAQTLFSIVTIGMLLVLSAGVPAAEPDPDYYHVGPLAGSLKSARPLPIYDADRDHLWNRLFAAFYTRISNRPAKTGEPPVRRIEGGDYIDFLAWGGSRYWSAPGTLRRLTQLCDEFLDDEGAQLVDSPLRRAVMLRDLWAAYDHYVSQNIRRKGTLEVREHRDALCRKLAQMIAALALTDQQIAALPNTYAVAVAAGAFATEQDFVKHNDYLPAGLLTDREQWVEIDFFQPDLHENLYDRFLTLHARAYRGRSYFRIFYRFPRGRAAVASYLSELERSIDWRQAAQDGFILLKPDAPQIPVGTEVALVQFMMTLNDKLQPTPTNIVESVRHRTYRNVDGSSSPPTNTGVGMQVMEYTLKRRLLFDHLRAGGLRRESDEAPLYRIIFQPPDAPDWGTEGRQVLFQQCANCHMTPKATRTGVHSMPSIVHMGGFDAGAQLGIAHPLTADNHDIHARRTARWKQQHETYRRLLEYLNR